MEINEIREQLIKLIDDNYRLPRYADIMKKMLGLHGEAKEERTFKVLADEYHVSTSRMRQIYEKCLRMLRHPYLERKMFALLEQYLVLIPDDLPHGMWLNHEMKLVFSDPENSPKSRKLTPEELLLEQMKAKKRKKRNELGRDGLYELVHSIRAILRNYDLSELSMQARICVEMRLGFWVYDFYSNEIKYNKGAVWYDPDPYTFSAIGTQIRTNAEEAEKLFEETMQFLFKNQEFVELMNKYLETFLYPSSFRSAWMNEEGLIKFMQ